MWITTVNQLSMQTACLLGASSWSSQPGRSKGALPSHSPILLQVAKKLQRGETLEQAGAAVNGAATNDRCAFLP